MSIKKVFTSEFILRIFIFLFSSGLFLIFQNCSKVEFSGPVVVKDHLSKQSQDLDHDYTGSTQTTPVTIIDNSTVACDPWGAVGKDAKKGLKAELYYANKKDYVYRDSSDILKNGVKSQIDLYFSDINVPTRLFSAGFPILSGGYISNYKGEPLIENFAIKYRTRILLRPDQTEGLYELASLADDASIVRVLVNKEWKTVVNLDGIHGTTMACGSIPVSFSQSEPVELEVVFAQGPRYHLAHVLMFRPFNGLNAYYNCWKAGNDYFFDSATSSAKQEYLKILEQNWKVISYDNYLLPRDTPHNPCVR
jgi:hypothetical protein